MKPLCEVIVTHILPAVRAIIAKKLILEYGYSQKKAAERMGLTQPAVSQYKRSMRGMKTHLLMGNGKIAEKINELAKAVAEGLGQEEQTESFCRLCKVIVDEGLACDIHRGMDESLSSCSYCFRKTQDEERHS